MNCDSAVVAEDESGDRELEAKERRVLFRANGDAAACTSTPTGEDVSAS